MPTRHAKLNLVVSDDGRSGGEQPHATRWTRELVAMLGKRPDAEIAKLARCSNESVRRERARRRIPAHRPHVTWTDKLISLLGKRPDTEVAKLAGCSRNAVEIERSRQKIASPR